MGLEPPRGLVPAQRHERHAARGGEPQAGGALAAGAAGAGRARAGGARARPVPRAQPHPVHRVPLLHALPAGRRHPGVFGLYNDAHMYENLTAAAVRLQHLLERGRARRRVHRLRRVRREVPPGHRHPGVDGEGARGVPHRLLKRRPCVPTCSPCEYASRSGCAAPKGAGVSVQDPVRRRQPGRRGAATASSSRRGARRRSGTASSRRTSSAPRWPTSPGTSRSSTTTSRGSPASRRCASSPSWRRTCRPSPCRAASTRTPPSPPCRPAPWTTCSRTTSRVWRRLCGAP